MLFLRCRAGLSHHPDEFATEADIDLGAQACSDFSRVWPQAKADGTGPVPCYSRS